MQRDDWQIRKKEYRPHGALRRFMAQFGISLWAWIKADTGRNYHLWWEVLLRRVTFTYNPRKDAARKLNTLSLLYIWAFALVMAVFARGALGFALAEGERLWQHIPMLAAGNNLPQQIANWAMMILAAAPFMVPALIETGRWFWGKTRRARLLGAVARKEYQTRHNPNFASLQRLYNVENALHLIRFRIQQVMTREDRANVYPPASKAWEIYQGIVREQGDYLADYPLEVAGFIKIYDKDRRRFFERLAQQGYKTDHILRRALVLAQRSMPKSLLAYSEINRIADLTGLNLCQDYEEFLALYRKYPLRTYQVVYKTMLNYWVDELRQLKADGESNVLRFKDHLDPGFYEDVFNPDYLEHDWTTSDLLSLAERTSDRLDQREYWADKFEQAEGLADLSKHENDLAIFELKRGFQFLMQVVADHLLDHCQDGDQEARCYQFLHAKRRHDQIHLAEELIDELSQAILDGDNPRGGGKPKTPNGRSDGSSSNGSSSSNGKAPAKKTASISRLGRPQRKRRRSDSEDSFSKGSSHN